MSTDRSIYQVVEVAPSFLRFGGKAKQIQEELNRLGAQGWELVAVTSNARAFQPAQMFLKRAQ